MLLEKSSVLCCMLNYSNQLLYLDQVKREQDGAWTMKAGIIIFVILALTLALGIVILR